MRSLLLYVLGVPIPFILLLAVITHHFWQAARIRTERLGLGEQVSMAGTKSKTILPKPDLLARNWEIAFSVWRESAS